MEEISGNNRGSRNGSNIGLWIVGILLLGTALFTIIYGIINGFTNTEGMNSMSDPRKQPITLPPMDSGEQSLIKGATQKYLDFLYNPYRVYILKLTKLAENEYQVKYQSVEKTNYLNLHYKWDTAAKKWDITPESLVERVVPIGFEDYDIQPDGHYSNLRMLYSQKIY